MALIQGFDKEYLRLYDGFSGSVDVGPGTQAGTYASDAYAQRKIKKLYMGGLTNIVYGGAEVDINPLVLVFRHENQYNTVLAFNLNYLPISTRKNVLKFIIESNKNRIRSQQMIMVSYDAVKRAVPQVEGCVRRYKLQLINVRETYPLVEWEEAVEKSGTQYSNVYKKVTS